MSKDKYKRWVARGVRYRAEMVGDWRIVELWSSHYGRWVHFSSELRPPVKGRESSQNPGV